MISADEARSITQNEGLSSRIREALLSFFDEKIRECCRKGERSLSVSERDLTRVFGEFSQKMERTLLVTLGALGFGVEIMSGSDASLKKVVRVSW